VAQFYIGYNTWGKGIIEIMSPLSYLSPHMGLYFGNALTLVLYPARNGPLNFVACVI
jgi:hypothetical protein